MGSRVTVLRVVGDRHTTAPRVLRPSFLDFSSSRARCACSVGALCCRPESILIRRYRMRSQTGSTLLVVYSAMLSILPRSAAVRVVGGVSTSAQPLFRRPIAPVAASRVLCSAVEAPVAAASLPRQKVGPLLEEGASAVGREVLLKGWVRTVRLQKNFSFVEVNDGSSLTGMQVVALKELDSYGTVQELSTGAAVSVIGEVVPSQGKGQEIEVKATSVELVGECPADSYPLQKKRHSLEFLRSIAHLRPRSNLFGAVARVRSSLAQATHAFFASEGFRYVQTPILTASDCEGAGEMFRVTTLDPADAPPVAASDATAAAPSAAAVAELEEQIKAQGDKVRAAKAAAKDGSGDKAAVDSAVATLLELKSQLEEPAASSAGAMSASATAEMYADDFFGKQSFLTVSGQLSAETFACALGDVYTFGPTFRAEQSNTARHLAEFWMIEPEMAFADLDADMDNAEKYVKYVVGHVMKECASDMGFFSSFVDKELSGRLTRLVEEPFARVTYTEAVEMLQEEIAKDPSKWEYPDVEFGTDLSTEHERWLAEVKFKTVRGERSHLPAACCLLPAACCLMLPDAAGRLLADCWPTAGRLLLRPWLLPVCCCCSFLLRSTRLPGDFRLQLPKIDQGLLHARQRRLRAGQGDRRRDGFAGAGDWRAHRRLAA